MSEKNEVKKIPIFEKFREKQAKELAEKEAKEKQAEFTEVLKEKIKNENDKRGLNGVIKISIEKLIPFKNQSFLEYTLDEMQNLKESIERIGLQNPIIVRAISGDQYEILAGHNRVKAFKELGREFIPARVVDVDDDVAQMIMIDTNIVQRIFLKPMDRAKAYKIKDELKKRLKFSNIETDKYLTEEEKEILESSEAKRTYYRYLSLNNLIPEYQNMCDSGHLNIKTGEQISRLNKEQQKKVLSALGQTKINEMKAVGIKKLFKENKETTIEDIKEYVSGNKKVLKSSVKFTKKEMEKYFSNCNSTEEIKEIIIELLNEKYKK